MELALTSEEFELFRTFIYDATGIILSANKIYLVKARLGKRVRELGYGTFRRYYEHLINDTNGEELFFLISLISTNVTSFFREAKQWEYLQQHLPQLLAASKERKLRIWSAACSSGEEPYSLAIFLKARMKQQFNEWDIKILATDISKKVLAKAIEGSYDESVLAAMPKYYRNTGFESFKEAGKKRYRVRDELREKILFRMFNLVTGDFSLFHNRFDIIFCRNVMIYFDTPTKQKLISRYYELLRPGGYLFVGHSESLVFSKEKFTLHGASIYQKTL